ncbi:MAG: ECF transporter S component, partial [Candidatus Cloacimonetes bacterium]|nr:ECF transporter S component [Candidatus Cloacimonadota bacterium]
RWGITSLLWGFVQALPVEIFFLLLAYKKWDTKYLVIAGMISALASFTLSFFWDKNYLLSLNFNIIQLITFLISGALLAGLLSKWLADGLKKTGVLNQFEIVKDDIRLEEF